MEEIQKLNKTKKTQDPEYYKKYYLNNKDAYLKRGIERKQVFIDCPTCSCTLVKKVWKQHTRTQKHLNNVEKNNINA